MNSRKHRAGLERFYALGKEGARRKQRDPLLYYKPTPPQEEWLRDPSPVKAFIAANQIGKSIAGCVEILWRCLGRHRYYKTATPPIEAWLITHSWEQSIAIQSKLHSLTPPDELSPETVFIPGRGFRGKTPVVHFKNGSIIRIKTTNQGSLGLNSATIDICLIDEPPPRDIWGELQLRIFRKRGAVGLTMTPIGRPVEWLKDLIEADRVSAHFAGLTPENCTPKGALFPFVSQEEIDTLSELLLPHERAQRLEGAWSGAPEGRIFEAYDPESMYGDHRPSGNYKIGVGIDHGGGASKQVSVLVAIERLELGRGRVWVIDESIADGPTTPEDDARDIIDMLDRNGLKTSDVDFWRGDRPYPGRRGVGSKSNSLLEKVLIRKARSRHRFRIMHPRKFPGSVEYGSRIIHSCMIRDEFKIRTPAVVSDNCLRQWTGLDDDKKHIIDAMRYIIVDMLGKRFASASKIRIY
jgi:phage terminase large subunit-like protein